MRSDGWVIGERCKRRMRAVLVPDRLGRGVDTGRMPGRRGKGNGREMERGGVEDVRKGCATGQAQVGCRGREVWE